MKINTEIAMDSYHFRRGQRRGEFREGNSHSLCVAIFGAIQGIAQEKVRIPNTPLPETDWLMDMVVRHTK